MNATIEKNGITVSNADDDELERWNGYVERSDQGGPFHLLEALRVQADHTDTTLLPLVGHKGQEPVGVLPLFVMSKGGVKAVFSPPPDLWVPYLGPATLNMDKLKQRKAERRNDRFVRGCLDWVASEIGPKYMLVRADEAYTDLRPFDWGEFDIDPRYTYEVDLTCGEDELLKRFSSDARSNIRNGEGQVAVHEGDEDAIPRIIGQVKARHDEQDEAYNVTPEFVEDLYRRLPEGTVRPYVCEVDGEFVGGMVTLELGDTIYRWQGGAKPRRDVDINDLLDWTIMRDAMDRDIERYDLVGANEKRLCGYKAKFNPELRRYHSMEKGTKVTNALTSVYKRFR